MNVTGAIWTLYPLLGFMALIEFVVAFAHIFFCLPFHAFLLPTTCGTLGSITAVYALLLYTPNRGELVMQLLSLVLGIALFVFSTAEVICMRRIVGEDSQHPGVCSGLLNRTFHSQQQCRDMLGDFQHYLLDGITPTPTPPPPPVAIAPVALPLAASLAAQKEALIEETRHSLRVTISTTLAVVSLIQVLAGVRLIYYSAGENQLRLNSTHWQALFGLLTLLLSYFYRSYCCLFFYSQLASWLAIFCLIQAVMPWPQFKSKTTSRQLFSILGAALSTALLAMLSFGIYCWLNRNVVPWRFNTDLSNLIDSKLLLSSALNRQPTLDPNTTVHSIQRYCHRPPELYILCERSLQFSTPYVWWSDNQTVKMLNALISRPVGVEFSQRCQWVQNEAELVQIIVYTSLTVNSLVHFTLFIYDAFGFARADSRVE